MAGRKPLIEPNPYHSKTSAEDDPARNGKPSADSRIASPSRAPAQAGVRLVSLGQRLLQMRVLVRVSVFAHGARMFFILVIDLKRRAHRGAFDARFCGQGGRVRGCLRKSDADGGRCQQQRKSEFHFQSPS